MSGVKWFELSEPCHDNTLSFKGLDIRSRPLTFQPLPLASIHTKRPQIERTFVGAGVRDVGDLAMSDDDETHLHVTYATHLDMDDAFCASMRIAIAAGLESAPVGVVTTPGTKNPRYLPTEHCPLVPAPGEWTF